ncbi:MAG: hypothetical protein ACLPKB_13210 [Xanthobacteraceae bacterium]
MLRFGFLPSDFHPLVLFLGEADDMRTFAALLRQFAKDRHERRLEASACCAPADGAAILLTQKGPAPGMRPTETAGASFIWTVEPWRAQIFADLVEELSDPGRRSGSAMLECEAIGETPVKVSLGEYSEDFLRPPRG